jgi:hypothetical protein
MTIWVGEVKGEARVYDPAIQLPDCPHLFLWDPASKEMGKFIANLTRQKIKPYNNAEAAAGHIAAYQQWYSRHGASWLEGEKLYYESRKRREAEQEHEKQERLERARWEAERFAEAERIAKLSLAERHRERLKRLGKEYHGVRPATRDPLRRRVTHCYSCRERLDNSVDIECVSCNWILCKCGACGCGYQGYA